MDPRCVFADVHFDSNLLTEAGNTFNVFSCDGVNVPCAHESTKGKEGGFGWG
jgi:hypothetical protein